MGDTTNENSNRPTEDQQEEDEDFIEENPEIPPPPDGGYGWVVVFASFMCNMIVDGIAYTFGIFLLPMMDYYGESKGTTAWVGSLLSGMYLSAGPVVSALTNKYGCRVVCIAGSLLSTASFILSTYCSSITWLMLVYGFFGGIGFGLIYLPAVVCVGYYFETKRSLATGIAVCGSGVGTFAFAPLASILLDLYGWQGANRILAILILTCVFFGFLMKPLTYTKATNEKPLLQRMAQERRIQMKRGSESVTYFLVQLPDGTTEKRMKQPANVDPGVHSSLNLSQIPNSITPVSTALSTIDESKMGENVQQTSDIPRNSSQPVLTQHQAVLPKNDSVPTFNRTKNTSGSESFKQTLSPIKSSSRGTVGSTRDGIRKDSEVDIESLQSKVSLAKERGQMVRPLSRKDIFYSRSIVNLREYQSQKSLTSYRQSVVSIPKIKAQEGEKEPSILAQLIDVSLLKDPAFMLIGVSNFFGMAGLYVPFVYLVDCAVEDNIDKSRASFLLSIIGITNTIGRIACGYFADFPQVDALLVNNICLVISTIAVALTPFCHTYGAYVTMAIFFGVAISGYISLTSIILVDLLGLDKLTNSFGLLILFRGAAAIVGSPLAGALYDMTKTFALPFYVAGAFFAISAGASFLAPCMKKDIKQEEPQAEAAVPLSPIHEDEEEN